MSLVAIKEWQQRDPKNWAVYIDAEFAYNESWAADIGVDTTRLKVMREEDGIKIFSSLCGVPHKDIGKPKAKAGLLDMVIEQGGSDATGLGIIVLDSVASIQSPIESIKEVGNTNIAPLARFLPDALKRLKPLLSQSGVTFIAINQLRVDPGKMYGDPTTTPGGRALKHNCDIMVNFGKTESKAKMFLDENDEPYGHIVTAKIDKNRVGPAHKKCDFDIEYCNGVVNRNKELANLAIKYNVIYQPNKVMYEFNGEKYKGRENLYEAFKSVDEAAVMKQIMENKLNKVSVKEPTDEGEENNDNQL
jgi:RecA/RadA recombinase